MSPSGRKPPKLRPGERVRVDRGIYARGLVDGSVIYGIRFWFEGREVRRDVGTITEARAAREAVKTDIRRREFRISPTIEGTDPTLAEFVPDYLEWCATNKSPATHELDKQLVKPLLESFGARRMSSIEAGDAEDHKARRVGEGRMPRTVNLEVLALQQIFEVAMLRGAARRNPVIGVRRLRVKKRRWHIITPDEEERLLAGATPSMREFIVLNLDTGLRLTELKRLAPADFHPESDTIAVYQSKTDEFKTIPLTARARTVVRAGIKRGGPTILVSEDGTPWGDPHPSWYRLLKRVGLKGIRIHDMRHTLITRLARARVDIRTIMDISGHEDVDTVLEYIESDPFAVRAAIDAIETQTGKKPAQKRKRATTRKP